MRMDQPRILIVEDDEDWQQALSRNISLFVPDSKIIIASTARDGIAEYRRRMGLEGDCDELGLQSVVLDYDLDVCGNLTSEPVFVEMRLRNPQFVRERLIIHTMRHREEMEEIFRDHLGASLPAYAWKREPKTLEDWYRTLPRTNVGSSKQAG
jgi:hypothetical protein